MPTQQQQTIRAPSPFLALAEAPRAVFEFMSLPLMMPLISNKADGDGHAVLVLPGLAASDKSTMRLRSFLDRQGYQSFEWQLGRNFGPKSVGSDGELLAHRVKEICAETGGKISIVGWSLGGIMARLLAVRHPEMIRQIITMGSAIFGDPKASNAKWIFERNTGLTVDHPDVAKLIRESRGQVSVPATSIYTKSDGIVPWQNCVEPDAPNSESIEVSGSHSGLGFNPAVFRIVSDRLAMPEDEWWPFDRTSLGCFK